MIGIAKLVIHLSFVIMTFVYFVISAWFEIIVFVISAWFDIIVLVV